MRIVMIVQARMGSKRLPGKILKEVLGKPLLGYLIERLKWVKHQAELVIATTTLPDDNVVVELCEKENVSFFRGSSDNVLDRFYQTSKAFYADVIVRVTADCPLMDPKIVDECLNYFVTHSEEYDYVSNVFPRTFPRGMDIEIFSFRALEMSAKGASTSYEQEHVTPFIYRNPHLFKSSNITHHPDLSQHRWTVDTLEDLELITNVLLNLYPKNPHFSLEDILTFFQKNPEMIKINSHIQQKGETENG